MLQKNTITKHANVKVTKNNGSGSDAVHAAKSRGMYGDTMAITYRSERGGTILYIIKWKKLKKKSGKDGIYDSTAPQNRSEVN